MIPNVGDKAVNAEDRITFCDEEPAYRRKQDTQKERERERKRGTKNIDYIQEMQQLQIITTTTTFTKVTRSLYIVSNLGKLHFMLFT